MEKKSAEDRGYDKKTSSETRPKESTVDEKEKKRKKNEFAWLRKAALQSVSLSMVLHEHQVAIPR